MDNPQLGYAARSAARFASSSQGAQQAAVQPAPAPGIATASTSAPTTAAAYSVTYPTTANSTLATPITPPASHAQIAHTVNDAEYQSRLLSEILRRVQELAYYMRRAMEQDDLATVLEKASKMLEELGAGEHHGHHNHHSSTSAATHNSMHHGNGSAFLTSRNYYELYMKILDELPNLEEYFLSQTMPKEKLYQIVQYSTRVVPRLYLQICTGSVLLRSSAEEEHTTLCHELLQTIKSIQCPIRGLFLRSYFLQALKDKLPLDNGYDILLQNFLEMNSLWIRIQHMPGSDKSKEARKKRERERTDLRTLVGTNLVRLSQLDNLSTNTYKHYILPKILSQIETCNDALAQAYVMDCIIQAFPDEFHLETLEELLNVCPKLKEKVNLRTILSAIMERFINYKANNYATLNDADQKLTIPNNAFHLFEDCIRNTFEHRKLQSNNNTKKKNDIFYKDLIRLQTSLLQFSIKCYPNRISHIKSCFAQCALALANCDNRKLREDEDVMMDLESFLTIPLEQKDITPEILDMEYFSTLLKLLPWYNRKSVAFVLVKTISERQSISNLRYIEELYDIITPLLRDPTPEEGEKEEDDPRAFLQEQHLVSKLVHLFKHDDTDEMFKMFTIARKNYVNGGTRLVYTIPPLIFAVIPVLYRVYELEFGTVADKNKSQVQTKLDNTENKSVHVGNDNENDVKPTEEDNSENTKENTNQDEENTIPEENNVSSATPEETVEEEDNGTILFEKKISTRKVFLFLQKLLTILSPVSSQLSFQLYLQLALTADHCYNIPPAHKSNSISSTTSQFQAIAYEFMAQAFTLYEEDISDSKAQCTAITSMVGTLLKCQSFNTEDYDALITKTTQYAAKLLKKPDQCRMVLLCSHLFDNDESRSQRVLECLQRSLKIADASVNTSPSNIILFVEILDQYVYYYENAHPAITVKFVTGLISLIKEHLDSAGSAGNAGGLAEAHSYFKQILAYIQKKRGDEVLGSRFELI